MSDGWVEVKYDLIELNVYRNDTIEILLEQFIFYEWDEESGRYWHKGWVVSRKCYHGKMFGSKYEYVVCFRHNGRNVRVYGDRFSRVETPFDLELLERKLKEGKDDNFQVEARLH